MRLINRIRYIESVSKNRNCSILQKNIRLIPEIQELQEVIKGYSGFVFHNFDHFYFTNSNTMLIPTATCLPFSKKIFISAQGLILPCERIDHKFSIGLINEKHININFKDIANKYNNYYDKLSKKCTQCSNVNTCGTCILSMNIDDKTPICVRELNKVKFKKYLTKNVSNLVKVPNSYKHLVTQVVEL